MERPVKTFCIALSALVAAACSFTKDADPPDAPSIVSTDTIGVIEARVVLPPSAEPLEAYDRYYALERIGQHNLVHGVFLLRRSFGDVDRTGMVSLGSRPNVYRGASTDLPIVADGGCAVVSVVFDPVSSSFVQIEEESGAQFTAVCNGLA